MKMKTLGATLVVGLTLTGPALAQTASEAEVFVAQAEKDLAAAEALQPSDPGLALTRAMIAETRGDPRACVAGYSKTLELQPNHKFSLIHRAKCEAHDGDEEHRHAHDGEGTERGATFAGDERAERP